MKLTLTENYSTEICRQEGANFRSVRLNINADGSLRLDAQDMGKVVEETWGDDDYEFWVDVPATALRKLLGVLGHKELIYAQQNRAMPRLSLVE